MSDSKNLAFATFVTPVPYPGHFNTDAAAKINFAPTQSDPGAYMTTNFLSGGRAPEIRLVKIDVLQHPSAQPGIYIGRTFGGNIASPLANPYSAREHGRLGAVELYRTWLTDKVTREKDPVILEALTEIRDQIRAGYDVTLKCWCFPNLCHGEVIREAVLTWEF